MLISRCTMSLLTICLSVLCTPSAAWATAKYDINQRITVDGKPAGHERAILLNCQTGDTIAGPIETDDTGSVKWLQVEDGKDCVRIDRSPSSGSTVDILDHTAQAAQVNVQLSPIALTWSERYFPSALCAGCLLLVSVPILQFLIGPWGARRDKLMGILCGAPMMLYYRKFRANVVIANGKKASDKSLGEDDFNTAFERNFGSWYGRRYYVAPLLLLMTITACCALWGAFQAQGWIDGTRSIDSMAGLAAAALTGGLMWVISDEIDRLCRHDFTTSDLYYYVFRILLAIPFAWAITRLQVTLAVGIPTAVFLGAFPTSSLFTIARRIGSQKLGLGDDPNTGQLELEKLVSIGKTNAERFKEADISNIGQLVRADPVDLAIRTNFDFDYISDCVNEALLWVYVGDELTKLAAFSLRGACEARQLYDDYNGTDAILQPRAKQTLTDLVGVFAGDKISLSEESLLEALRQAGYDPYTEFLLKIWK